MSRPFTRRPLSGAGVSLILLAFLLTLPSCTVAASGRPSGGKLRVVASTTIVGDVVRNIGGDHIEITVLVPIGADIHAYEPTPQDLAAVSHADLIFVNGFGLEAFLGTMVTNASSKDKVISVSDGIKPRQLAAEGATPVPGEEAGMQDPHVWLDPVDVEVWADNIARACSKADPANASAYSANAASYKAQLQALDAWVQQQVSQIPPEKRILVTDHDEFGYFADRYGFKIVGTVVPSYNTLAEPSAQDLAALERTIKENNVKAIFVSNTTSPVLEQRIAADTGAKVVTLYAESLSQANGPAPTYIDFMKYTVTQIVDALK